MGNVWIRFCLILLSIGSLSMELGCSSKLLNDESSVNNKEVTEEENIELAEDILLRIENDYSQSEQEYVKKTLLSGCSKWGMVRCNRISRCVLHLSNGDVENFKRRIELANTDWRDIITNAEYNRNADRIYDFSKPFGENKL